MVLSSTNFRASLGTLLAEVEDYLAIVLGYTRIYILLSSFLFPFGIKKIKKYILSLEEIAKILILIFDRSSSIQSPSFSIRTCLHWESNKALVEQASPAYLDQSMITLRNINN